MAVPAAAAAADEAKPAKALKAAPAPRRKGDEDEAPALARPGGLWGLEPEVLWMGLIVAIGAFLRLWALGDKPLHHDESIHAFYAWKLYKGEAYRYDPAYHGPFRYHMNALMFFIFGASDFTTRLLPAIVGISGIAFLWQWRGLLGRKGAIFAAAMVAISPSWVYNSRFIRDDVTMAVGMLLIVWGLFRHFESRQPKHLFWAVAGLMVSFTSHEGTWILLGILGSFLVIRWLWERSEQVEPEYADLSSLVSRLAPPLVAPAADVAGGVAAVAVLAFGLGSGAWRGMGAGGVLMGLVISYAVTALGARLLFFSQGKGLWRGMLAIFIIPFSVLYSTGFTNMDGWFTGAFDSIAYWLGEQKTGRADQPWQFYLYMLSLYELAICAFAGFGGLRLYFSSGKPQHFFMKIVAFFPFLFAIAILISYPKEPRMVPVMSLLAVIGGGLAAWSSFEAKPGNHFKVFLLYWSMLALIMFTIAGERMPWLTLHPLTPLTLLAALYLDDFFSRDEANAFEHGLAWAVLALPLSILAVMLPRQLIHAAVHAPEEITAWLGAFGTGGRHGSFQPSGWMGNAWVSTPMNSFLIWVVGALAIVLAVLGVPIVLERWPKLKGWTRGVFIGLGVLGLATLSHGTMNLIFHGDGADPREQHVYVQSSIELVELTHKLDRMSRALTGGPYMKIAVEDLCSWPMSWYLRDFEKAQIGYGPPLTIDKVPDYPVVLTGYDNNGQANHDQAVADSFSNSYTAYPIRFRRWWAPDRNAFNQGSFGDQAGRAWNLFMYREPWMPTTPIVNPQFKDYVYPKGDSINSPYGSFDACVWVRKDVEKYFQ
jgi:uncharacterized protein (TIGR03663 family)